MGLLSSLLKIFLSCVIVTQVRGETYNVRVGVDRYVNVVSRKFLSFTVDPKYLFSTSEKFGSSQESICMAATLTPAYLRIAGPSTAHMTFQNSTITIDSTDIDIEPTHILDDFREPPKKLKKYKEEITGESKKFVGKKSRQFGNSDLPSSWEDKPRNILGKLLKRHKKRQIDHVEVTSDEWKRFTAWAKGTGFEIVFALNNEEKSESGLWDPNTALYMLSVAERESVEDIYWQLGYECSNQTIDEYLIDLDTLRVIVDSALSARGRGWRVLGADVTSCLREQSRSDFKDYVALALEMTDAMMLDGNSSSHQLERLSPPERHKLLSLLHASGAPLWLTEGPPRQDFGALERAASWMASLGHSARRGAQVHFRELTPVELYQPTLSFYMALLYKNLVGERVLNVDIESSTTILFAHCTSLRHQRVPGAVTLYGANMDDEPARLSLKLGNGEGGDIMQFVLSEDEFGNIIVNGRHMSQKGDIRPVVKHVRRYKTLLINLPARSFGFWVLTNTKIEPCLYLEENTEETSLEAELFENNKTDGKVRSKRSVNEANEEIEPHNEEKLLLYEYDVIKTGSKELDKRIESINNYLREIHNILNNKPETKVKRQTFGENQGTKKMRRQLFKMRHNLRKIEEENKPLLSFIGHLLQFARNGTKHLSDDIFRKGNLKLHKYGIAKRHNVKEFHSAKDVGKSLNNNRLEQTDSKRVSRTRRSIVNDNYGIVNNVNKSEENELFKDEQAAEKIIESLQNSTEDGEKVNEKMFNVSRDNISQEDSVDFNEVEIDNHDHKKLWKVIHNIQHQLNVMADENSRKHQNNDETDKSKEIDKVIVKTELTDDGATINFKEQPNRGWVKSTFESIFHTLNDLNENINKFWEALSLFE